MKWENKKLSQKQKIKIILISIYAVIFIIVSKIYLIPIYKKYEAEQLRKRQILVEKEEKERIESEFKSFGDKFNSLKIVIEKFDNPENPAEIRAEKYYIINPKAFSFAKNVIYSDKFIYIVAEEMIKYDIGNGKQLYLFRNKFEGVNAKVISKKSQRHEVSEWIYLLDGKLFFYPHAKPYRYITVNYTEIESKRKTTEQEMKKLDEIVYGKALKLDNKYNSVMSKMEEEEQKREEEKEKNPNSTDTPTATPNIYYYRPNSYKKVFTREEMEKMDKEEGRPSRSYYYYYPNGNTLTQKELDKLDAKENERERRESDESEFEDREEREYWESEEYWGEEGIEKEVY